ncbi:hypothetical protein ACFPOI_16440 [Nonomuraea angiospora]|uniref:Uncharacterized protein n=1 Tax=Nonomuraea angiospora TaxID=46172 RepID=A0ABR9MH35_9ACTN|nr:hypothetical protein [Nonomuraea angiospora]MBE1592224.1 hypothetical protein [Nonomuraea angiospora]
MLLYVVQFPAHVTRGLGLVGQVHGVAGVLQKPVQVAALKADGGQVGQEAAPAPERGGGPAESEIAFRSRGLYGASTKSKRSMSVTLVWSGRISGCASSTRRFSGSTLLSGVGLCSSRP